MSNKYVLDPSYGKQSVPVFKIRKNGPKHSISDMVVKITLRGKVSESWLSGENHEIVPTETQKNTCYALALKTDFNCIEDYGLALGRDVLSRHAHLQQVKLEIFERKWDRVKVGGSQEHNHVFMSARDPYKTSCVVVATRGGGERVTSGVFDLKLLKTTQSGFQGFIRDQYTNLEPTGAGTKSPDRVMSTELEATWTFARRPPAGYAAANAAVMQRLLDVFSGNPETGVFSKSVQETAYRMATTVLNEYADIDEVFLATPNIHHYTYPLEKFGLANPNLVFQSTDCHSTASGRIETRVSRRGSKL